MHFIKGFLDQIYVSNPRLHCNPVSTPARAAGNPHLLRKGCGHSTLMSVFYNSLFDLLWFNLSVPISSFKDWEWIKRTYMTTNKIHSNKVQCFFMYRVILFKIWQQRLYNGLILWSANKHIQDHNFTIDLYGFGFIISHCEILYGFLSWICKILPGLIF